MEIIKYPSRETWETIVRRPQLDVSQLHETVNTILEDVQNNGDKAVLDYEKKFDHANLESLAVNEQEICDAMIEQFTTMSFDGITGTGMTWGADGAVTKAPKGMVIKDGAYVGMD